MRVRKKVKGLKLEKPVKPRAGVKQIPLKESPETAKQLEQAEKQDKIAKEQFEKSLKSGVPTQSRARFEEATKELEEKAQLKSEKKILERGKETPPLPRNDEPKFGIGLGGISLPKIDIKIGKRKELKVTFDDATKERDWNDARGLRNPTLFSKVMDKLRTLKIGFTRQFVHLPNNDPQFAEAKEILRQLKGSHGISSREAIEVIKQITKDVSFEDIDLAMRKLKLEDYREGLRDDKAAPFGFTEAESTKELAKIEQALATSPQAQRVVTETRELLDEIGQKLVDAGILSEGQLVNKEYFHRQILKYSMEEHYFGQGRKKLKKPRPGFAKKRKGSELEDNTDYLQAVYSYLTDVKHDIRVVEMLERLRAEYDILPQLRKDNKGVKGINNLLARAPEGYTVWQPEKGNLLFKTNSVVDKLAQELYEKQIMSDIGEVAGVELTMDDMRTVMALGAKKQQWVIPDELADQLNDLSGEALLGSSAPSILKEMGIAFLTRLGS